MTKEANVKLEESIMATGDYESCEVRELKETEFYSFLWDQEETKIYEPGQMMALMRKCTPRTRRVTVPKPFSTIRKANK